MRVLLAEDKGDGAGGGTAAAAAAAGAADAGKTDAGQAGTAGQTTLSKAAGADGKAADTTKAPDAKDTKAAAPDYEKWAPKPVDGLKRPEPTLKAFREAGKKFGLSPDQMQGLVDFDDSRTKALAEEQRAEQAQRQKGWLESFQNDKEFGGAKLSETSADIERVMKKFGDEDLRQLVDETGYGDHPALLKFVARIGKATREDTIASGAKGVGAKKPTLLDQLYGSGTTAKS